MTNWQDMELDTAFDLLDSIQALIHADHKLEARRATGGKKF